MLTGVSHIRILPREDLFERVISHCLLKVSCATQSPYVHFLNKHFLTKLQET